MRELVVEQLLPERNSDAASMIMLSGWRMSASSLGFVRRTGCAPCCDTLADGVHVGDCDNIALAIHK